MGEPLKTYKKAIKIVTKNIKVEFSDLFDIVITSNVDTLSTGIIPRDKGDSSKH